MSVCFSPLLALTLSPSKAPPSNKKQRLGDLKFGTGQPEEKENSPPGNGEEDPFANFDLRDNNSEFDPFVDLISSGPASATAAAADVETKNAYIYSATATDGAGAAADKKELEIAAILGKIEAGVKLQKGEITKIREHCFKTPASDFPCSQQGLKRPFRVACANTEGAQIIQQLIEDKDLPNQFVPGDSHVRCLGDVIHLDMGHFAPIEENIREKGNLYLDPKTGLPGQVSLRSTHSLKTLIGHFVYGKPAKEMQDLVMSRTALVDVLMADADSYLHTDSTKSAKYDAFFRRFYGPSRKVLKEMIMQCKNLETITVFGHAMCKEMNDDGPLNSSPLRKLLNECRRSVKSIK